MVDPDFTSEERQVLGALMQPERRLMDQTVDALARDLGMDPQDVARVLDELEARGVVETTLTRPLKSKSGLPTTRRLNSSIRR